MTFPELMERGRKLTQEQLQIELKALTLDQRFAAVLAVLDMNREAMIRALSDQSIAGEPGKQSHAAGSVHAFTLVLAQLANVMLPPTTGGMIEPEDNS